MKQRILVYVALLYGLGICFSHLQPLPLSIWLYPLAGFLALWLFDSWRGKGTLGWLLLIAFFFLGAAHYHLKNSRQIELLADLPLASEVQVAGKVLAGPFTYPSRTLYEIQLKNKARVQLQIKGGSKGVSFKPGDAIIVKGYLERPNEARNPGEFDYRAYLWRQGLLAEISASPQDIVLGEPGNYSWQRVILGAKARFQELLDENMSSQGSAVTRALIFGDKTALEQDLKELFVVLGIMHLLAVSGLHVGFLLLLAQLVQRLLGLDPRRGFWFTLALLILYAALTDFTPSVLRASLMAFVLLLGGVLRREGDFYTSLAAAGLILLFWNPFNLFQSGFQLSFLAAWGILYFRPLIKAVLPETFRWREMVMVPAAAQVAVLPAIMYYFNLISLIGFFANIVLVPIAGFIVIGGLVAFIISLLSTGLAGVLLLSLGAFIDFLIKIFIPLGSLPWSAINAATPSWLFIVCYYLMGIGVREILLREAWQERIKASRKPLIIFCLIISSLILGWQQLSPRPLEVVFLDVGQGDAIFLRTPKGKVILLDGGGSPAWQKGSFRVGREIVVPYLQRRGIKKIDLLISSHPDSDHLQGLEDVLMELDARAIILPPQNIFGNGYNTLTERALVKQVPIKEVEASDTIYLDSGIILEVLNPPNYKPFFTTAPDNNHSLLLRVNYGAATFLFSGDVEIEALQYLAKEDKAGSITVFKAPHHGSRTGYYEPYLDQMEPVAVVLSVGRNNYGHPAVEVTDYWEQRGIALYRTDHQGAIMMYTDGKKLSIKPFINGH